jgi:DNA (cytosine-5)-methyltransferase 1
VADGSSAVNNVSCRQVGAGSQSIRVVSFFCGCGGLDLGFRGDFQFLDRSYAATGFEVCAAYDIDERSIAAYRLNLGSHAQVLDLAQAPPQSLPQAEVLLGGFPCQEFSSCGPRKGIQSERGMLYRSMVRYAAAHQPLVVVAENVAGLLTLNGGADLQRIKDDFASVGYRCQIWEMHADEYGVPQARHRVFLIFVRADLQRDPSPPPHEKNSVPVSVKSAIQDLLRPGRSTVANQNQYFKAAKAGNGHGQGDERSPRDFPGYTVRANSRSRVQFHYSRPRRLTVRECARLQTFPDTFQFPFAATANMKLIGNAVPPVLAHKVALQIYAYIRELD